jgi:uncharacterized repeat protein (TIGR03806 family)
MRLILPFLACFAAAAASSAMPSETPDVLALNPQNPASLSAFGFFAGAPDKPSPRLIAYTLRTPLFSDYAEKQRFIYLPADASLAAGVDGRLEFPVGSALIKSFGYPDAGGKLKILETRILLHRAGGWVALPYVWRADGSDADLRIGGTRIPVTFNHDGSSTAISYSVPNKNQCKQCHSSGDQIMPIGPIWQNMEFPKAADRDRFFRALPALAKLQPEAKWDDPKSGTLNQRAHSYLRVNCGHCHSPNGSASNSGLFLDGSAKDRAAYGIAKRPVAAGRASGDLDFIIEQGRPDRSILLHRMKSTDSGIAMPELGRATVHDEGVKLLGDWIAAMPKEGAY